MTGPLLKIEHLEVRYGDLIGVSDVSLEVAEGSVVALLGSNGGGKTTTLNAIAGLIPVHSGSIRFRGEEIGGQNAFAIVRKGLALSPEGWRLFVQQSVENNLLLGATPLREKSRTTTLPNATRWPTAAITTFEIACAARVPTLSNRCAPAGTSTSMRTMSSSGRRTVLR